VVAFVNTAVPEAASLVATIQKLVDANKDKNLKAFVVFQGGPELKDQIEKLGADYDISIPMTFLPKGKSDKALETYKINPEAKTTILVTRRNRVLANFVDLDPMTVEQLTTETKKMLEPSS
jgi:hypothetical protein